MNKRLLALALIASSLPFATNAACNASSLAGTWDVKYRYSKPQQVGECTYLIDEQGIVDGSCFNITYGQKFNFFEPQVQVSDHPDRWKYKRC